MAILNLNAKNKNRFSFSYDANLAGFQIIFRIKKDIEDTTAPLIEALGTISTTTASLSTGYFDIDLTNSDLIGKYYFEFEMNNGATINEAPSSAPVFFEIGECLINRRLDN